MNVSNSHSLRRKSGGAAPEAAAERGRRRRHRVRDLVGLEIEPGQLVAAKSHVNGHVVVEKAVGTPIAPNLVRDGEVTDVEALTSALAERAMEARQCFTTSRRALRLVRSWRSSG